MKMHDCVFKICVLKRRYLSTLHDNQPQLARIMCAHVHLCVWHATQQCYLQLVLYVYLHAYYMVIDLKTHPPLNFSVIFRHSAKRQIYE